MCAWRESHRMANLPNLLVCGREHAGRITKNTRGLGRDRKMAIQGSMLDQLDISYSDQDLLWHYLLTQKPDPRSQRRTSVSGLGRRKWLYSLAKANERCGRFEAGGFSPRCSQPCGRSPAGNYSGGRKNGLWSRLLGSSLSLGIPGNLNPGQLLPMLRHRPRTPELDNSPP